MTERMIKQRSGVKITRSYAGTSTDERRFDWFPLLETIFYVDQDKNVELAMHILNIGVEPVAHTSTIRYIVKLDLQAATGSEELYFQDFDPAQPAQYSGGTNFAPARESALNNIVHAETRPLTRGFYALSAQVSLFSEASVNLDELFTFTAQKAYLAVSSI